MSERNARSSGKNKKYSYLRRLLWVIGSVVLLEIICTGVVLAHISGHFHVAVCMCTGGYLAAITCGGGIMAWLVMAIVNTVFGGGAAGSAGAFPPIDETPPSEGGVDEEPEPPGPEAEPEAVRTIIDADGEPLIAWSSEYAPGENGYSGKPGDVWYDGNWVDPEYAREQVIEDIKYQRLRDHERETFWQDVQNASENWLHNRTQQLEQEAQMEQQEIKSRQEAMDLLDRIEDSALRRGYSDILQRAESDAFNPDGSVNEDYVKRLRDTVTNRIGRDVAAPDEALRQGWVGEFVETTIDDARHNPLIRMGAGMLTLGQSEIFYQSQAAWEAMQRSYNDAVKHGKGNDWSYGDALWAGGKQLAEENLPVNIIKTVMDPKATSTDILLATAMDMFQSMDTAETIQNLRGSYNAIRNGKGAWSALTHRAEPLRFWPGEEAEVPAGSGAADGAGRVDVEAPRRAEIEGPTRADIDGPKRAEMEGRGRTTDIEGRGDASGAPLHDSGGSGRVDMEGRVSAEGRLEAEGAGRADVEGRPHAEGEPGLEGRPGAEGKPGVEGEGAARADVEGRPRAEGEPGLEGKPGAEGKPGVEGEGAGAGSGGGDGGPPDLPEGVPGVEGKPGLEGDVGFEGSTRSTPDSKFPDTEGEFGLEGPRSDVAHPGAQQGVDELAPGSKIEPEQVGLTNKETAHLQKGCDKYNVDADFRKASEYSRSLRELDCPPKPPDLHCKGNNLDDVKLGLAQPEDLGKTSYFDMDKMNQAHANLEKIKADPSIPDSVKQGLERRYWQRFNESADLETQIKSLQSDGKIRIDDHGTVINTGLDPDTKGLNKPFVADTDVVKLRNRDTGLPVSPEVKQAFFADPDVKAAGVTHPELEAWQPTNTNDFRMQQELLRELEPGGGKAMGHITAGGEGAVKTSFMTNHQPIEIQNPSSGDWTRIGEYTGRMDLSEADSIMESL